VAPIVEFDDDEEVVRLANDTEYGLVSYLYTRDVRHGLRMADRLDAAWWGSIAASYRSGRPSEA